MPSVGKRPLTPTTRKTWGPLRLAVPPLPKGEGNNQSVRRRTQKTTASPRGEGGRGTRSGEGSLLTPAPLRGQQRKAPGSAGGLEFLHFSRGAGLGEGAISVWKIGNM